MVKLKVEPWSEAGAVSLQAEQWSAFGEWVSVLGTTSIGTFPNYTTTFTATPIGTSDRYRYRWETGAGKFTNWLAPVVQPTPTDEAIERMTEAVIAKATRILSLAPAPLGYTGDLIDEGAAMVRPDHQIQELLYGLRFRDWDVDLTTLVETDDVIRHGLGTDPDDFDVSKVPDVQRAIDSAVSWVAHLLLEGAGVA